MEKEKIQSNVDALPFTDLQDALLAEMRLTVKTLMSNVEQYLGISIERHRVFQHLFTDKELSQGELERRLGVDGAVITRLVKQMEAEGLITRRPDPADNRFTLVTLTVKAHQAIDEMLVKRRELEKIVMQGIHSEDIACTQRVLARMRHNANQISAARPSTD